MAAKSNTVKRKAEPKRGWFEEYECCGCVSEIVKRKKDLIGYCGQHGYDRRGVFRKLDNKTAIQTERTTDFMIPSPPTPAYNEAT